jgi:hypothetical protein
MEYGHQTHFTHQTTNPTTTNLVSRIDEHPAHLPRTKKRQIRKQLVNQAHQLQLIFRFALGLMVIGRALQIQQLTLVSDTELGMSGIDDPTPSRGAHILAKAFCKKSFSMVS